MHEVLANCLFKLAHKKVWLSGTDRPAMTIVVDLGRKATKQTNNIDEWLELSLVDTLSIASFKCSCQA